MKNRDNKLAEANPICHHKTNINEILSILLLKLCSLQYIKDTTPPPPPPHLSFSLCCPYLHDVLRAKQVLKASELMRAAYHEKEVQFNPIKDNQRPTATARFC